MNFNKLFLLFLMIFCYKVFCSDIPLIISVTGTTGDTTYKPGGLIYKLDNYISNGIEEALNKLMPEIKKYNLINKRIFDGQTPLIRAITYQNGFPNIAKLLLDYGADPNEPDQKGNLPLNLILKFSYSNFDKWKNLLDALLNLQNLDVNKKDIDGLAPLFFAADYGPSETVQKLIELGADVNMRDKYGNTPLHHLTLIGRNPKRVKKADILLDAGALFYAKNRYYNLTPIDMAIKNLEAIECDLYEFSKDYKVGINEFFKDYETAINEFLVAAKNGNMKTLQEYVENEIININSKNKFGMTALEVAEKNNQLEAVKYLLLKGAKPNTKEQLVPTEESIVTCLTQ